MVYIDRNYYNKLEFKLVTDSSTPKCNFSLSIIAVAKMSHQ